VIEPLARVSDSKPVAGDPVGAARTNPGWGVAEG
jgi:hypothetical protein